MEQGGRHDDQQSTQSCKRQKGQAFCLPIPTATSKATETSADTPASSRPDDSATDHPLMQLPTDVLSHLLKFVATDRQTPWKRDISSVMLSCKTLRALMISAVEYLPLADVTQVCLIELLFGKKYCLSNLCSRKTFHLNPAGSRCHDKICITPQHSMFDTGLTDFHRTGIIKCCIRLRITHALKAEFGYVWPVDSPQSVSFASSSHKVHVLERTLQPSIL